ncbi:MAG: hypothetical protein JXB32_16150 [Deltaproteobacteria bacterium]|nr:hypothetical protein [Deltaproteobacteria bacterium]
MTRRPAPWVPLSLSLSLSVALSVGCDDNLTHPERDAYDGEGLPPLLCVPNLDGRIDAEELEAVLGVPVSYLISPPSETRTIDLVGGIGPDGRQFWDWGADYASDQVLEVEATEVAGKWYASSFPTGEFVTPLDAAGTSEAVYRHEDTGLYLLGMASKEESPAAGQTLLVYSSPVLVYRFPLVPGDRWVSVGEVVGGTLRGLPYAGRDTYEVEVAGAGRLVLPDLEFSQAMLVQVRTVVEPAAGASVSQRQASFVFECFGEVARAVSRPEESSANFTTAQEVRRYGLGLD